MVFTRKRELCGRRDNMKDLALKYLLILLPLFTEAAGRSSYACTQESSFSCSNHHLYCTPGNTIHNISAFYGYTNPGAYGAGLRHCCYNATRYLHKCEQPFNELHQEGLLGQCHGQQSCYYKSPMTWSFGCTQYYNFTHIQYDCAKETRNKSSYVYAGDRYADCSTHHLSCYPGETLHIISASYGYAKMTHPGEYVNGRNDCSSDIMDIVLNARQERFGLTAFVKLLHQCHKQQSCLFQSPTYVYPLYNTVYHSRPYSYIFTRIDYGCYKEIYPSPITRRWPSRTTIAPPMTNTTKITSSGSWKTTHSIVNGQTEAFRYTARNDTSEIVGSVIGCLFLVVIIIIIVVTVIKRKLIQDFIGRRFKDRPLAVTNPGYETPTDGYNNVIFTNGHTPVSRVAKTDEYNHLHDFKGNNSNTTSRNYNHLLMTGSGCQPPVTGSGNSSPDYYNLRSINNHANINLLPISIIDYSGPKPIQYDLEKNAGHYAVGGTDYELAKDNGHYDLPYAGLHYEFAKGDTQRKVNEDDPTYENVTLA